MVSCACLQGWAGNRQGYVLPWGWGGWFSALHQPLLTGTWDTQGRMGEQVRARSWSVRTRVTLSLYECYS